MGFTLDCVLCENLAILLVLIMAQVFATFVGEALDIQKVQNFYLHSKCGSRLLKYSSQRTPFPQYCPSCCEYCLNLADALHEFSAEIVYPSEGELFFSLV